MAVVINISELDQDFSENQIGSMIACFEPIKYNHHRYITIKVLKSLDGYTHDTQNTNVVIFSRLAEKMSHRARLISVFKSEYLPNKDNEIALRWTGGERDKTLYHLIRFKIAITPRIDIFSHIHKTDFTVPFNEVSITDKHENLQATELDKMENNDMYQDNDQNDTLNQEINDNQNEDEIDQNQTYTQNDDDYSMDSECLSETSDEDPLVTPKPCSPKSITSSFVRGFNNLQVGFNVLFTKLSQVVDGIEAKKRIMSLRKEFLEISTIMDQFNYNKNEAVSLVNINSLLIARDYAKEEASKNSLEKLYGGIKTYLNNLPTNQL